MSRAHFDDADRVADLARFVDAWQGTPFFPRSMAPGPRGGVDCLCLAAAGYLATGVLESFEPSTLPAYSLDWSSHNREDLLGPALLERIPAHATIEAIDDLRPGDLVVMRPGHVPYHLALVCPDPDSLFHVMRGQVAKPISRRHRLVRRLFCYALRPLCYA